MSRPALAFALLLCLSGLAQARYRIPSREETLGKSSLIVVGEVLKVGKTYTIKIEQQIVGPEKALKGTLSVHRRPRSNLCVPQDPKGVVPGTRWVWVLEPVKGAALYRSWVCSPYRVEKGRVQSFRAKGAKEDLRLPEFVRVVEGLRRCYAFSPKGKVKRLVPASEVEAFAASSPLAAELVADLPR